MTPTWKNTEQYFSKSKISHIKIFLEKITVGMKENIAITQGPSFITVILGSVNMCSENTENRNLPFV